MDLIYMDENREEVGVLLDYTFDLAFGIDENNFECEIDMDKHCCEIGYYLSIEGTEYGGVVDSISVDTLSKTIQYKGRTWHGILDSKVIEPDAGEDYFTIMGEANAVIGYIIVSLGLSDLFSVSAEDSGITIPRYQMNRYITGYEGIVKMLNSAGAKLDVQFHDGSVYLRALPIVDYSKDDQFDADQIAFRVQKNGHPVNHVICLGKGDLKDREVIHIYTDEHGNISPAQMLTGVLEVAQVYDYSSAESTEELRKGGLEIIAEAWNSDKVELNFDADANSYDIGDKVGAVERTTGIDVVASVSKKIVTIRDGEYLVFYKVGE